MCRYVRLNALNVLHVHGPRFNAPKFMCYLFHITDLIKQKIEVIFGNMVRSYCNNFLVVRFLLIQSSGFGLMTVLDKHNLDKQMFFLIECPVQ